MDARLHGVFAFPVIPVDASGVVSRSTFRRSIDYLISGVHAFHDDGPFE